MVKFSTLVTTIKAKDAFTVSYQSLEIGSYRQRLSDGSESAIKLLYNYILPKISYNAFRSDLIALVNCSSYEIFSSRSDTKWEMSIYPAPPMADEEVQVSWEEMTVEELKDECRKRNIKNVRKNSKHATLVRYLLQYKEMSE